MVYSPHGLPATAMAKEHAKAKWKGLHCLALLHGFDDITLGISLWLGSSLNLGVMSGVENCNILKARKWIRTHDEDKNGAGIVAWLLQRRERTKEESQELLRKKGNDKSVVLVLECGEEVNLL